MQQAIEQLEKISRNDLQERVLKFLKDQEFIKEHLRKGGSFKELKQMGFKFGTFDISRLPQGGR